MNASDAHLERALEECNDRVNALESSGGPELMDAYVSRGCVLHMLGYGTSAMEDLESAYEMASAAGGADPGLMVKMLTKMGCIAFESGSDPSEYYLEAIRYLPRLKESSGYFDRRSLVRMAVESSHDLLDSEQGELAVPFLERALEFLEGPSDPWTQNRRVEILNLLGEAHDSLNETDAAIECYTKAIDISAGLLDSEAMEEPESLVLALVSRGETYLGIGQPERYIEDAEAAIAILDGISEYRALDDADILVSLHQGIADELIKMGRTEEAEKHLLKAMEIGISGAAADRDGGEFRSTFGHPPVSLLYGPILTLAMQGLFCEHCKSLMPPGTARCRNCGWELDGSNISPQTVLTHIPSKKKRAEEARVLDKADPKAPFMPYPVRGSQLAMIEDILGALNEGKHIIMESGTGTGKTVTSLAAALEHARSTNKKIVYLVRTISQGSQVMRELRAINRIQPVCGMVITGRQKSCPLFRNLEGYEGIPSNVLSMMCDAKKQNSIKGIGGGCRYFDRARVDTESLENYVRANIPDSSDLDTFCENNGICPYEARKALMKSMDVIVVAYTQILTPEIRSSLLANMGLEEDYSRILLIIDEAHNFIDQARDAESFSIDTRMVNAAIDECSTFRSPEVHPGVQMKTFIEYFKNSIRAVATQKLELGKSEVVIQGDFIEDRMMEKFSMTRMEFDGAIDRLVSLGEARTEVLMEKQENRMSDIHILGEAMSNWCTSNSTRYIRSLKVDKDGEVLSAFCMDPRDTSMFLNSLKGAVHMSGTLAPMDQYARVLGLSGNPRFRTYPSPFPPENRKVIYIGDATTATAEMKKDPTHKDRLERYIASLCNSVDKNTLVFFTSYGNMSLMRPYLERHVDKVQYWEERGNSKRTMQKLDAFRNGRNGVFFTVMGGNIAEGIDFPGDELCFAIIVGIPFPPPDANNRAMQAVFDERYAGKGFVYVSLIPAMRKMKQAIGRLIRTETDRGMAVILDSRMARYQSYLPCELSKDPAADAARFFKD